MRKYDNNHLKIVLTFDWIDWFSKFKNSLKALNMMIKKVKAWTTIWYVKQSENTAKAGQEASLNKVTI